MYRIGAVEYSELLLTYVIQQGILARFLNAVRDGNRDILYVTDIDKAFVWIRTEDGQIFWDDHQETFLDLRDRLEILSIEIFDALIEPPLSPIPYKTEPLI